MVVASLAKTIDEYVIALPSERKKIASSLIQLEQNAAPSAKLSIKSGNPVFEQNGPFCYIRAFQNHVNFWFWRGAQLESGKGLLQLGGEKMAHIKISNEGEIQKKLF